MTSRVGDIVIDCADPERLAEFWCDVLGYRIFDRDGTGVAIRGATVSPDNLFIRVAERKATKIGCTSMFAQSIVASRRSWPG